MAHYSYLSSLIRESNAILSLCFKSFDKIGLLFSGGKDSCVLLHLVQSLGYKPDLISIDTGYNFPEINEFFDSVGNVKKFYVADYLPSGQDPSNVNTNAAQSLVLKDIVASYGYQVLLGGARRDEDKARSKEHVFSHRDADGGWKPENQRLEYFGFCTDLRLEEKEHFRVFPLSNWLEADVWEYIDEFDVKIPSMYFAHERAGYSEPVRFRTIGDMKVTKPIKSNAKDAFAIWAELVSARREHALSERGATRMDDKALSLEERKRQGYF